MGYYVFPTHNDLGDQGYGTVATEESMAEIAKAIIAPYNYVISGYTISYTSGLTIDVASGVAMVDGYQVESDSTESVTVNANENNQNWYLQLTRDSDNHVNGTQWIRVVNPTLDGKIDPPRSVKIFSCDTDADSVSTYLDERRVGFGYSVGSYTGDGDTVDGQEIDLGFFPVLVYVVGAGTYGNRTQIVGMSSIRSTARSAIGMTANEDLGMITTFNDLYRPLLTRSGFIVRDLVSEQSLNVNGEVYTFIAFR